MNAAVTATELLSPSTLDSGGKYLNFCSSISPVSCGNFTHKRNCHSFFNLNSKNSVFKIRSPTMSMGTSSPYKPEEARVPPALPLPKPPLTKFKIALCQLAVTADKERNIVHAREAIMEAAGKGAQIVLLPEIWNSPYSNDSFPLYAEDIDAGGVASPSTAMLSELSRILKITIIGGSIPERSGDKLYNTCCVFGTDGKLIGKHRKIHLFDIDIPGKMTFKESKTLTAGESPTIVDTEVGRVGIGICYDIRFQELAAIYAARGAHLLCYPGAFNMTTGPLHWELLQRARGADCQVLYGHPRPYPVLSFVTLLYENQYVHGGTYFHLCGPPLFMDLSAAHTDLQLYVATCSPARDTKSSYVAWGHSTLVGPQQKALKEPILQFGEVLATTEHEEVIIVAEIDYSLIEQRRTYLPFQKQRRGDLYQLVDVHRLNSNT